MDLGEYLNGTVTLELEKQSIWLASFAIGAAVLLAIFIGLAVNKITK